MLLIERATNDILEESFVNWATVVDDCGFQLGPRVRLLRRALDHFNGEAQSRLTKDVFLAATKLQTGLDELGLDLPIYWGSSEPVPTSQILLRWGEQLQALESNKPGDRQTP